MKYIFFSILFFFVPKLVLSQSIDNPKKDGIVCIDSLGQTATEDDYKYVRIIKNYKIPKADPYQVREYYKSGKIATIGSTASNIEYIRTGTFLSFYENGSRKSIQNYRDNKLFGIYLEFYDNGDKKLEAENIEDEKNHTSQKKINQFWDRDGIQKVIDGNGFLEIQDKNELEKGEIKNGFKNGLWEGNQFNSRYKETYNNGKLISGESIDEFLESHTYTEIEKKPETLKGMNDFYQFIAQNYRVPNVEGLNGKIILAFIVDKDGKVIEPKIIKGIDSSADKEAIRVLLKYGSWKPGEQRGRKVKCRFSLPITIRTGN